MPSRLRSPASYLALLAIVVAGCTRLGAASPASPAATAADPPAGAMPPASSSPTPATAGSDTGSPPATGRSAVVATFDVVGETYRILLVDEEDIAIARKLLAGEQAPNIPNGLLVRGVTGVNVGHDWSIDPESVEFADVTIELCDGLPSQIDDGTFEGDRFCPWSAKVVDLQQVPSLPGTDVE